MDNTYRQTCPHCQANCAYLRAVKFSEAVKTLSFRCDECGAKWDVASQVPISSRLTLVHNPTTSQGMR